MSSTCLKILALIFMTIDHIGAMIPGMPICLRWIGRLSAPIFLFCVIEGIQKTHNRKKYCLRMYLYSIGMAVMNMIINYLMPNQAKLEDNIFLVYFSVISYVSILEWSMKRFHSKKQGIFLIAGWQLTVGLVGAFVLDVNFFEPIYSAVFGLGGYWLENTIFVILGVLLYWKWDNKKEFLGIYILFSFVPSMLRQTGVIGKTRDYLLGTLVYRLGVPEIPVIVLEIVIDLLFALVGVDTMPKNYSTEAVWLINYQWMMIAAIPFFLLYNGKRGKGFKYFFYWYYPLHILLLAFIRILI